MQTELLLQVVEVELSFLVEIKEEEQEADLLVPMDSVVIVQLVMQLGVHNLQVELAALELIVVGQTEEVKMEPSVKVVILV